MRNFDNIDGYLNELSQDIYSQPPDEGHTRMMKEVIEKWTLDLGCKSVLDVGCGAVARAQEFFKDMHYMGISLGEDAILAQAQGLNVREMDMSFLDLLDETFDLIFCRHTLEHSPMPVLTLMEFHRVSRRWLCLVMPNPQYYTYSGRNHYYLAEPHQITWLLRRAGWKLEKVELTNQEFRFLCEKQPRIGYEGYTESPISHEVYQFERDGLDVSGNVVDVSEWMEAQVFAETEQ